MTDRYASLPAANIKPDIKVYVVDGRKGEVIMGEAPTILTNQAAYRRIGGIGGIDLRTTDNVYVAGYPANGTEAYRYVQVSGAAVGFASGDRVRSGQGAHDQSREIAHKNYYNIVVDKLASQSATDKLRRDYEPGSAPGVVGGQAAGEKTTKDGENEKRVGVGSRRIDTAGTGNKYSDGNKASLVPSFQEVSKRQRLGAVEEGCTQKCRKWLIILVLLLLLAALVAGALFTWFYFHPSSGLPRGYECPEGYFVNATKCLECAQKTKWNGTDCLTEDNKTILYTEAPPVKIDPTVMKAVVGNKNATDQSQCAQDQHYREGMCLKCPEGSSWNGSHCKIIVPPVTDEIKAQLEAQKANNSGAKLTCKEGEFILNDKCVKCPEGTTWDGSHCIKKVIITTTQDEKHAPIPAHNIAHRVSSAHLRRRSWSL